MAKIIKICENKSCKKEFSAWPKQNRKYCCRKCQMTPERRETIGISKKGKPNLKVSIALKNSPKAKVFQFKKGKDNPAYGRDQKGELNPNWKGGATNKNQKLRNDPQYKIWRQTCMERDHYQCTECGAKGYLQVHHIKTISESPELIWVVENGKTVCVSCHEKIHGRFIGKFKQK